MSETINVNVTVGAYAICAREAHELATLGGAACLGRNDVGCPAPGRAGD